METQISTDENFLIPAWPFFFQKYDKVAFDRDFVFATRNGVTKKIDLKNILEIKTNVIPFRSFYQNSYVVTIIYVEDEKKSRVKFFSKGSKDHRGSVAGIPHLDKLKQTVLEKKYSGN